MEAFERPVVDNLTASKVHFRGEGPPLWKRLLERT
jgi:hypothetical protein